MTRWVQDYLPGMEFLGEEEYCPCCSQVDDPEFAYGESCD